MAIAFADAGTGVSTQSSGAALSPANPATVNANDILIIHAYYEGTTAAPATPNGFTLLGSSPYTIESTIGRHWVFGKIADGTEGGASNALGTAGGTDQRAARVYRFSGYVGPGAITDITGSFAHLSHATDPQMPTVTTSVNGGLAVALVAQNDNNAAGNATGESGGDWTEATAEYTANLTPGLMLQVQTATPTANPGTISGGSVATTNDPCGVIGFAIHTLVSAYSTTDSDSATASEAYELQISAADSITLAEAYQIGPTTSDSGTFRDSLHYLRIGGAVGYPYISTPDTASLDITSDIDMRIKVALDDWTAANTNLLAAKAISNDVAFLWVVTATGALQLYLTSNGSTLVSATSSTTAGVADGATKWLRATWRNSDNRVQFFTGDDGVSWTQLGTNQTINLTGIKNSAAKLTLGSDEAGLFGTMVGNIFSFELRDGIDGTVVANPDFEDDSQWQVGDDAGDAGVDGAGKTWTLENTGKIAPYGLTLSSASAASDSATLSESYVLEIGTATDSATFGESGSVNAGVANVDKSDSDSLALAESVVLSVSVAGTETATFTETVALSATAAGSDSHTLTETGSAGATLAHSDSAAFADSTYVLEPGRAADSVTATDTASSLTVAAGGSDFGVLAERVPDVAQSVTDSLSFTDPGSVSAAVSGTDAASAADTGSAAATVSGLDSGTLTERTPDIAQTATDSAAHGETISLSAAAAGSDSFTHTEGGPQISLEASDSATLGESGSIDQGIGSESKSDSDTFTFGETATVSVTLVGSDSATLTETSTASATINHNDSGTLGDSGNLTASIDVNDTATLDEAFWTLAAALVGADSHSLGETGSLGEGTVNKSASDTFTVTDTLGALDSIHFLETGRNTAPGAASGQLATAAASRSGVTLGAAGTRATPGTSGSRIASNDDGRSTLE